MGTMQEAQIRNRNEYSYAETIERLLSDPEARRLAESSKYDIDLLM